MIPILAQIKLWSSDRWAITNKGKILRFLSILWVKDHQGQTPIIHTQPRSAKFKPMFSKPLIQDMAFPWVLGLMRDHVNLSGIRHLHKKELADNSEKTHRGTVKGCLSNADVFCSYKRKLVTACKMGRKPYPPSSPWHSRLFHSFLGWGGKQNRSANSLVQSDASGFCYRDGCVKVKILKNILK